MKRFFLVIMAALVSFQLVGCGMRKETDSSKIKIVTTVFPVYDFVRNIAGDEADVKLLMPAGAEAHSYEPTVQDAISIKECDLFVCLGKGAEPWTEGIITEKGQNGTVLEVMEYVDLKSEEHSHDGHTHYEYDQHVWTSIRNSRKIVSAIADELGKADAVNKDLYHKRADEYNKKLEALDVKFKELTGKIDKTVVFADRFPFRYFAEDYGFQYFAAYPGCSSESEPSAATVAELINKVKNEKIPVVFYTETSNGQLPDAVCEETGAKKALLHSCHNVSKRLMKEEISYIKLMEDNFISLKKLVD